MASGWIISYQKLKAIVFDYCKSERSDEFLAKVSLIIGRVIDNVSSSFGNTVSAEKLLLGKLLRTRFASRLIHSDNSPEELERRAIACAATELVHTASLCHDDVIDQGLIRHGVPPLWRETTPSCSVLVGDLLLSESVILLLQFFESRCVSHFVSKVKEICTTEIEQEIILRGKRIDESTCMRIARGKTGPLFGFVGYVMGEGTPQLAFALEEAGYLIGTAYQLYDDLIDIAGTECLSGKTLKSDIRQGKVTLPQLTEDSLSMINSKISELCSSATDCVKKWPHAQWGIETFFECDLQPEIERILLGIKILT